MISEAAGVVYRSTRGCEGRWGGPLLSISLSKEGKKVISVDRGSVAGLARQDGGGGWSGHCVLGVDVRCCSVDSCQRADGGNISAMVAAPVGGHRWLSTASAAVELRVDGEFGDASGDGAGCGSEG